MPSVALSQRRCTAQADCGDTSTALTRLPSASATPATPCGACWQLLAEFGLELEVISAGPKSERRWTLAELLPAAFTKESLDT